MDGSPEGLSELQWLINNALSLFVVTEFGITLWHTVRMVFGIDTISTYSKGEILSQRMAFKAVICQNTATRKPWDAGKLQSYKVLTDQGDLRRKFRKGPMPPARTYSGFGINHEVDNKA